MDNNLTFLHANCRSLPKNFDNFTNLLSMGETHLTAVAVSETWLKPSNENLFKSPGYCFESNHRESKIGGGVALYINESETYKLLPDLKISSDYLECIFVEIVKQKNKN